MGHRAGVNTYAARTRRRARRARIALRRSGVDYFRGDGSDWLAFAGLLLMIPAIACGTPSTRLVRALRSRLPIVAGGLLLRPDGLYAAAAGALIVESASSARTPRAPPGSPPAPSSPSPPADSSASSSPSSAPVSACPGGAAAPCSSTCANASASRAPCPAPAGLAPRDGAPPGRRPVLLRHFVVAPAPTALEVVLTASRARDGAASRSLPCPAPAASSARSRHVRRPDHWAITAPTSRLT
ncbi:hypothetical protein SNARM312S_05918 [Streptomyces narbonensis]